MTQDIPRTVCRPHRSFGRGAAALLMATALATGTVARPALAQQGAASGSPAPDPAASNAPAAASPSTAPPSTAPRRRSDSVALDVPGTARSAADWVKLAAVRLALVALRTVADVRFEAAEVAPDTGGVLVTGMEVTLPLPYASRRACTVRIDSFAYEATPLALLTGLVGPSTVEAEGVSVPLACMPPEAQGMMTAMRLDALAFDALRISSSYDLPTGSATVDLRISAPELADIEARGVADYLSVRFNQIGSSSDDGGSSDEPVPAIEFGPIDVTIVDRGLVEKARPFLGLTGMPPEQVPAAAAQALRDALGANALAEAVEAELTRFLSEGGRLTLALRPEQLWLEEAAELTPPELVRAFNPRIGATTLPPALSPELIAKAAGPGVLQPEEAFAVARAFISGNGMPRNPRRAFQTIEAYANTFDVEYAAEARAIAAEALLEADANLPEAYRLAIQAGTLGHPVSPLLRRAEARLSPGEVVAVQRDAVAQWTGEASSAAQRTMTEAVQSGDTGALLDLARRFESGIGAPRSVAEAMMLALLAEAGGEIGARSIVERAEATAGRNIAAREAFEPVLNQARDAATNAWLAGGMGEALARRVAQ